MARRRAESRQQPRYSSSFLLFFFLPPPAGRPASFCRCTTRRVHDSSLSHSKPLRYGLSSSSSDWSQSVIIQFSAQTVSAHLLLVRLVNGVHGVLDGHALEVPCRHLHT